MPTQSQTLIRRDINRLSRLVQRHQDTQPVLAVIAARIHRSADRLNQAWNYYQRTVHASEARTAAHDAALNTLLGWIHRWRPAIMLLAPEAEKSLGRLDTENATPREIIRLAENIRKIIAVKGNGFHAALDDFGFGLTMLCQDTPGYASASPYEIIARETYMHACIEAHTALIHGAEIIRAVFGRSSREYQQFVNSLTLKETTILIREARIGEL